MSVETLRRAAADMREKANAATPSPWRDASVDGNRYAALVSDSPPARPGGGEGWEFSGGYGGYLVGESLTKYDRAHIASWHPLVALAVADWLDDIAERHQPDPEPAELVLHYDSDCPTGECEDPGYHTVTACIGCYPSWDGMDGRAVYPCSETKAALVVARAYLGEPS